MPPSGAYRRARRRAYALVMIMLMAGAASIIYHLTTQSCAPTQPFCSLLRQLPGNAAWVSVIRTTQLERLTAIRDVLPTPIVTWLNQVSAQIVYQFDTLNVLDPARSWVGEYVALALYDGTDTVAEYDTMVPALPFALAIPIRNIEAARADFEQISALLTDATDTSDDLRWVLPHLTLAFDGQTLILTNLDATRISVPSNIRIQSVEAWFNSERTASYDLFSLVDLQQSNVGRTVMDQLRTLNVPLETATFGVGVVTIPDQQVIVDVIQLESGITALTAVQNRLGAALPPDTLLAVELNNPQNWYQVLITTLQHNGMQLRPTLDPMRDAIQTLTTLNYETDLLRWMTGDALFFVSPSRESDELPLGWALVVDTNETSAARRAYNQIRDVLPFRTQFLTTLLPDIPLTIRAERFLDHDIVLLDLFDDDTTMDIMIALIEDDSRFVVGNRAGLGSVHTLQTAEPIDSITSMVQLHDAQLYVRLNMQLLTRLDGFWLQILPESALQQLQTYSRSLNVGVHFDASGYRVLRIAF
jgi:hypothetical protein